MTRLRPLYILTLLVAMFSAVACNNNDQDTYYYTETQYTNCALSSFSLSADSKILSGLDSVFFSIDLITAEIFNADSLPPHTDVTRLVPKVSASAARTIEFTFKSRFSNADTTVNYTEHPNDSINFSSPVRLTVTAYNGGTKRDYTVRVNVHNVPADTLVWDIDSRLSFPSAPSAQRSVTCSDDHIITLLRYDANNSWTILSSAGSPFESAPVAKTVTMPADADINTFAATPDGNLFIATSAGALYSSADLGDSWTDTGATMHCIYGSYGSTLIGARLEPDGWKQASWPAEASDGNLLPPGCPVSDFSRLVTYTSKWTTSPMTIMVGGRDRDGNITGDSWGYDGNSWHKISTSPVSPAHAGMTIFPYYTTRTSGVWRPTEQSVLLAMGGTYIDAESGATVTDNTVYVSRNFGISWTKADTYMQMPETYPGFHSAQAFVIDRTLSRAIRPITEWECPYIYLYGGIDANGVLLPYITCGVINRFTFKPIQ